MGAGTARGGSRTRASRRRKLSLLSPRPPAPAAQNRRPGPVSRHSACLESYPAWPPAPVPPHAASWSQWRQAAALPAFCGLAVVPCPRPRSGCGPASAPTKWGVAPGLCLENPASMCRPAPGTAPGFSSLVWTRRSGVPASYRKGLSRLNPNGATRYRPASCSLHPAVPLGSPPRCTPVPAAPGVPPQDPSHKP